ncbi:MAG TPA: nucleotidyltransferase domain-containing protein [Sedimentisphaerales bacterium]|nr:nucleotidyltransferase domain-containing protein [Sedimentisphaerales bacterium]
MRTTKKAAIDWLLPEVRKEVLALLLTSPQQSWHLRDIARKTGFALGTIQRELTGLAQAEIVLRRKDGNRMYYQANKGCPIFPELSGLLRKTAGLADILKDALKPLSKKIRAAFVYGSFAANSLRAGSDVDLMVIGSCGFGEVVAAVGKTQEELGREINPSVYPVDEFRKKMAAGHHFLKTVLAGPKVFLIGDEYELERLA